MTHPKTLLLLTALATLAACKSGPAKVCDKIDALAAKAMTDGDEGAKKMATGMQAESSTCLTRMQTLEQKDPAEFATAAACIDEASEIKQVVQCFFKAALGDDAKALEPAPAK